MITWLDGGFLFELNKEYGDLGQEAVLNAPEKILVLYKNYIRLGCTYITTNNYGFKPSRMDNWRELCIKSGEIFRQLKDDHPEIQILGSIPPFYPTYKQGPITAEFTDYYTSLIPLLVCDNFLLETQVSIYHIREICRIIHQLGHEHTAIYVSLYPDSVTTEELNQLCKDYPTICALLVNCCSFEKMNDYYETSMKSVLAAHTRLQFGFYLNKINEEHYAECQHIERLQDYKSKKNDTENIKNFIERYYKHGDLIIGGCCGYGADEMRDLMEALSY